MKFDTAQELLDFINNHLDGSGLTVTDDEELLTAIQDCFAAVSIL